MSIMAACAGAASKAVIAGLWNRLFAMLVPLSRPVPVDFHTELTLGLHLKLTHQEGAQYS
jgi:hypothetical protein